MKLTRRTALALSAAAGTSSLVGFSPAFAAEGDVYDIEKLMAPAGDWTDKWLGDENAPVTMIEYASSTCGHCAAFHAQTYPQFKADYIDTGKVRFTMRPFLLNILDAVVFMLAVQAEGDKYYDVLDVYLENQTTWSRSETPRDAIFEIAKQLGYTEENFEAALTNQSLFEGMELVRQQASEEFELTGTPSFYVNGKMLTGSKSITVLAEAIDPLLA